MSTFFFSTELAVMVKADWLTKCLELEEVCDKKVGEIDREEEEEREEEKERREVEGCENGRRLEEDAEKSTVDEEEAMVAIVLEILCFQTVRTSSFR